jgi:hypothetical protein
MLQPEIIKEEHDDKEGHKYPENCFFSEKLVDEHNQN